jgi:hypothetical protein
MTLIKAGRASSKAIASPGKKGSPTIGRDYQSASTTTIATPAFDPAGRELDHVCGAAGQVVRITEEFAEHVTPRCGADQSAAELYTLAVDVAEVLPQPVLVMGKKTPPTISPGSL